MVEHQGSGAVDPQRGAQRRSARARRRQVGNVPDHDRGPLEPVAALDFAAIPSDTVITESQRGTIERSMRATSQAQKRAMVGHPGGELMRVVDEQCPRAARGVPARCEHRRIVGVDRVRALPPRHPRHPGHGHRAADGTGQPLDGARRGCHAQLVGLEAHAAGPVVRWGQVDHDHLWPAWLSAFASLRTLASCSTLLWSSITIRIEEQLCPLAGVCRAMPPVRRLIPCVLALVLMGACAIPSSALPAPAS